MNLAEVLCGSKDPSRLPVLVTMEVQRGVVGDLSSFPALVEAATATNLLENLGRLARGWREKRLWIVHCTASFRADRMGSAPNAPLITAMMRKPEHLLEGTEPCELIPVLGPEPGDLISNRRHGVSPFIGTDLDAILRRLGASTLVVGGVSLNLGIVGLAVEAVNLGYRVVVATDAVAGVPLDYGQAVLDNTLSLLCTLATVDEIIASLPSDE